MKKNIFIAFVLCIFLCSCVSTQTILIDIKQPASIILPPDIVNIALVDNAAVPPLDSSRETLKTEMQFVSFDSIKNAFMINLYNKLSEKNFFGDVQIYPYQTRTDTAYFKERLLTKEQIADISQQTGTDAILSLDNFGVISSSQFVDGYTEIALCIRAKFRLFTPDGQLFATPVFLDDTLYWSEIDYSYDIPIIKKLPTLHETIQEINNHASELVTRQFIPFWVTCGRLYFLDKVTTSMIKEDRWEDARLFWTKSFYEEKETKRIKKARLAYNIALACEFTDNIEEANIWINKACEILPSSASANLIEGFQSYKVDLYKRLRSKTMLTKALSE